MISTSLNIAIVISFLASNVISFAPSMALPMISKTSVPLTSLCMSTVPTPEESAKQLTEYMAKAHEEKIRAVSAAEAKNKSRIQVSNARLIEDNLNSANYFNV